MRRAVITATGSYLPDKVLTNADLEKIVDTSDEWITQRTGITERHIAGDNESTSDMAVAAARAALERHDGGMEDIDCVIVATTTPDQIFPSVAVKVQADLGIPPVQAFDVQAVCSGFVYGLSVADSFIQTGKAKKILLIGAEKMSAILNWEDRGTCILFGDGAGAVILEAEEKEGDGTISDRGVLSTHLMADGNLRDILYVDGGPATSRECGHIVMEGKEVFRYAVHYMAEVVEDIIRSNNLKAEDLDWLIPHQANVRIIEATAKKLGLPMEKVVLTVSRHGNTSAASIPLALDEVVRSGKVKQGDLLLLEALGAGLTWGAALVRL